MVEIFVQLGREKLGQKFQLVSWPPFQRSFFFFFFSFFFLFLLKKIWDQALCQPTRSMKKLSIKHNYIKKEVIVRLRLGIAQVFILI